MNIYEQEMHNAIKEARNLYKKMSVYERSLPISVDDIMKYYDYDVTIQYVDLKSINKGLLGSASKVGSKCLILCEESLPDYAQRFTVTHEFGHIISRHLDDKKHFPNWFKDNVVDTFAAEILMPRTFLNHVLDIDVVHLANVFNVSKSAINKRFDELKNETVYVPEKQLSLIELYDYTKLGYGLRKGLKEILEQRMASN